MHNSSIEVSNYPRRSKGGTHSQGSHRSDCRQNEDDADKQRPKTGPAIHKFAEDAHVPRSWLELPKQEFAQNGNTIAPIKSDCANVEDSGNGSVRSQANQVNGDAEKDRDPYSVKRSACLGVDFGPDVVERNETIT
jgi:hypothetical protein